tara:strand:- start:788 stop:1129 length:342 start_codon:yes stop_codon:yes gene_type:complete
MSRFLKYQFESEEAWNTLKATITETENELETIPTATVVELGNLVVTDPVFSEDGREVVTPAVLQTEYSVDILWNDEEAEGFDTYRIYCDPTAKAHTFYGLDDLYEQEYNNQPE